MLNEHGVKETPPLSFFLAGSGGGTCLAGGEVIVEKLDATLAAELESPVDGADPALSGGAIRTNRLAHLLQSPAG